MIRKLTAGIALITLLGLAPSIMASPRVYIRPYAGFYYGPSYHWYPGPWYGGPVYFPAPVTGELKINTDDKDARVYVDGGFLGIARKTKKFDLRPGNHDVELRDARGTVLYEEKVAIVPGHTTEFNATGIGNGD
jgi:PEGA domain